MLNPLWHKVAMYRQELKLNKSSFETRTKSQFSSQDITDGITSLGGNPDAHILISSKMWSSMLSHYQNSATEPWFSLTVSHKDLIAYGILGTFDTFDTFDTTPIFTDGFKHPDSQVLFENEMFFIGVDPDPLSNNYAGQVIHYLYKQD